MTWQATVLSIMIGGPSDTEQEVNAVRTAISHWNDTHAQDRKIVVLPRHWKTHAAPATGHHPQQIIDKQVASTSDALIAIFKGTPGNAGTIHEIEEFTKAGKTVQIYFQNQREVITDKDADDWKQVLAIKEKFRSVALYGEFKDADDLRSQLTSNIESILKNVTAAPPAQLSQSQPLATLSAKASALLTEAANTGQYIQRIHYIGGARIGSGKSGYEGKDPREIAAWEDAINELESNSFVKPNSDGTMFTVTHDGYTFVDQL